MLEENYADTTIVTKNYIVFHAYSYRQQTKPLVWVYKSHAQALWKLRPNQLNLAIKNEVVRWRLGFPHIRKTIEINVEDLKSNLEKIKAYPRVGEKQPPKRNVHSVPCQIVEEEDGAVRFVFG